MKRHLSFLCLIVLLPGCLSAAVGADDAYSWQVASPDGKCAITVSLERGELSYYVSRNGKIVIPASPLGLRRDDESFETGLKFTRADSVYAVREKYQLMTGPQPQVDHILNHQTIEFSNTNNVPLELDLAASDEGVAFRYRFPGHSNELRIVESERTAFTLPLNARGWLQPYHAAGPYTPAYEDFYFAAAPGDHPPDSRAKARGWAFPALFHVPDADAWVLISESGTDASYCACHLGPDSAGGVYHLAFPWPDEATGGQTNTVGPEPRYPLPWTMPWRVFVLGHDAGDIATATLITDLAPPSQVADTSWIHPGRASWAWWSYPDESPSAARFNEFTDLAARMGWEYTLFDAGWWGPGLKPIADHAHAEKIHPLAWLPAGDFYTAASRKNKLDEMARDGIEGVKVDFWCSDRQEAIAAQQALMADTAARHMVLNLHGCTIPRGWQRTWPNFLSCEAVLGSESYFYEPRYTQRAAELDTVLPFTRNAVGPMDLTPVACTQKKFARTTTAAHQLATVIIFTCGIDHYADQPEFFASLPSPAFQMFRDAPSRWDETRCLLAEPGRAAIFAKRTGHSWFIAGLNGTSEPLPVNLDLSSFAQFPNRTLISEGQDPIMQVAAATIPISNFWSHTLPPRGGFILRLDKSNL